MSASDQWLKQVADTPLFSDLLWSRPENRLHAGKLLIIGGNAQAISAPAQAFQYAHNAGAGTIRVLLPDALQKTLGPVLESGEYTASTPSGSFARKAVADALACAQWSDGVCIAGDLGRNSETAIMLETFLLKYTGTVTLTRDAIEYITAQPAMVATRPKTTLVLSFSQLQRLAITLKFSHAFTSNLNMFQMVAALQQLSKAHAFAVVTKHLHSYFVAVDGRVSTTPAGHDQKIWRLTTASTASVWQMQHQNQFEAITTSLVA